MAEQRFSGQTAIITGAAQGIGLAVAERLASEGASIWIFDRSREAGQKAAETLRKQGAQAAFATVDVTDEASVQAGFGAVAEAGDTVHIMVNAAGIVGPVNAKSADIPVDGFISTQQVNLVGSFIMMKHALRAMKAKDYGRICLVASISGKEGNAGMVAYSTSKAGVIGMAKAAGKEYAETGITVNAIAPAVIRTPMVEAMPPEQVKYMTDKIPMKRCGTLEEVAAAVAWIVSPEASFNSGFCFDLTGGRAVY